MIPGGLIFGGGVSEAVKTANREATNKQERGQMEKKLSGERS